MAKILVCDKGGRKERKELINKKKAPRDFLQGIDYLKAKGFDIENISSSVEYERNLVFSIGKIFEQFFSKISNIGIRPLSVLRLRKAIKKSKYVVSFTDGFSLSLGFYYAFFDRKNKIKLAGAFHKLSDFDSNLPIFLRKFYLILFSIILKRLDYIIFFGGSDRLNSQRIFNLKKEKTFLIKFGVDTLFWIPKDNDSFSSNYLFSIGQDPARDFETLLRVKTNKKIHIHTCLLSPISNENFKITNGSFRNKKKGLTDLEVRKLYQDSFCIVVPLKNVFQPSGYSVTLQALACGKPVILTLTKGLWAPKLFKNLDNCILVNPSNEGEIENAIELLEKNEDLYKAICQNARRTAEKHFSLTKSNKSTLEIFKNFV